MKKVYKGFFLFLCCLGCTPLFAQTREWQIIGKGNHQYSDASRSIAVDQAGNSYIVGYYRNRFAWGDTVLFNQSDYYGKIYISKVDAKGKVEWLRNLDTGKANDNGVGIALDDYGNCFITGSLDSHIFAAKYDSQGNKIWLTDFGKLYFGAGNSMAIDSDDNIYVLGKYENNIGGMFFSKLDRQGKLVWVNTVPSTCHTSGITGSDIAVDASGNSYVAGVFECDTLKISGFRLSYHGYSGTKTFVAKYSSAGKVLWALAPYARTGRDPRIVLTEQNEVVLAGTYSSYSIEHEDQYLILELGKSYAPYLMKVDTNGELIWLKRGGTWQGTPRKLLADYDGNIHLGGTSWGGWGDFDFHLEKYSPAGDLLLRKEFLPTDENLYSFGVDTLGNYYVVGHSNAKWENDSSAVLNEAYSTFVVKIYSGSKVRLRPYKPLIEDVKVVCKGDAAPELVAKGVNIAWYDQANLQNRIHVGSTFVPGKIQNNTFYVTQEIQGAQSWGKKVVLSVSDLEEFKIEMRNDTLFAPYMQGYTYQWWYGDSLVRDSNHYFLVPKTAGIYKVTVTDGLCAKGGAISFAGPLAVTAAHAEAFEVSLFPNPARQFIHILVKGYKPETFSICIYNQAGEKVISVADQFSAEGIDQKVDIRALSGGLYFCELVFSDRRKTIKFLKDVGSTYQNQ